MSHRVDALFVFNGNESIAFHLAKVAELADAPDLGSGTARCGGSSPPFRTSLLWGTEGLDKVTF